MKRLRQTIMLILATSVTFTACKRETPEVEPFGTPVPATYDFSYVDYSGQIERLDQLEEMVKYLKTANQQSVSLDTEVLKAMFANTGGNANGNFPFSSTKNIKDKTFEPHWPVFEGYFEKIALASQSNTAASNGVAGVMLSGDGTSGRLFDENGYEYAQLIEKGLMGALCYYQATSVYLSSEKMEVDNEEIDETEGSAMMHHWDEAYGYLGVNNDFPENTEDVRFWGKYCVSRDAAIGSNEALSGAFRRGRAAIVWHRYEERDLAIGEVREAWEDVCAATAIHYINEALANLGDDYTRNHVLSEAHAFVQALFYNPEKRVTEAQIDQTIALLGDNFYEVSTNDLQAARDLLAGVYGWESIKNTL